MPRARHADRLSRPQGRVVAREVIAFFAGPSRERNEDEERHVFAILLQSEDAEVKRAAEFLCENHAWIELNWLDIEAPLAALARGESVDHRALRSAADVFDALMRDHIALKESLFYPQLRGHLKSDLVRSISPETAAHRDTAVDDQTSGKVA